MAAEEGNTTAMIAVGNIHEYSEGPEKNDSLAMEWYTKAADAGDIDALVTIANCHYLGSIVEKPKMELIQKSNNGSICAYIPIGLFLRFEI